MIRRRSHNSNKNNNNNNRIYCYCWLLFMTTIIVRFFQTSTANNSRNLPAAFASSSLLFRRYFATSSSSYWSSTKSSSGLSSGVFAQALSTSSRRSFLGRSSTATATAATMSTTTNTGSNYWNREISQSQAYDASAPVIKPARIVCLADIDDPSNAPLYEKYYNDNKDETTAKILAIGSSLEELKLDDWDLDCLPNVLYVSPHPNCRQVLSELLPQTQYTSNVEWIHARSAGIDFMTCPALSEFGGCVVTNAKGSFSSTLAEYTMLACGYFAKDLPRLLQNKYDGNWEKYSVEEIRGSTLGIIGYGDIGKSTARLAKAYGMKIIALKNRKRDTDENDIAETIYYGKQNIPKLFQQSDYVLCSAPLTQDTIRMINYATAFENAGPDTVFINVGRGPIVNESDLVRALRDGKIKGAALDVFTEEPLPKSSPLWTMDNVLLSPHNMDQTETFMKEACEFFVDENLPRFVRNLPLMNPVNPKAGY